MIRDNERSTTHASESGQRYEVLLDQLAEVVREGDDEKVAAFLQAHPDDATQLRRMLPAMRSLAVISTSEDVPSTPPTAGWETEDLSSNRVLGDFRILREIGRGGMGVVYEAEQISLGRRVALKVLPFAPLLDEKRIKRFQNEARAAATLDHPHIVPVISVGEERGVYYYAMSLIRGQSLAEIIAEMRASVAPADEETPRHDSMRDLSNVDLVSGDAEQIASPSPGKELVTPAEETRRFNQAAISTQPVERKMPAFYRKVAKLGAQAAGALHHAYEQGGIY